MEDDVGAVIASSARACGRNCLDRRERGGEQERDVGERERESWERRGRGKEREEDGEGEGKREQGKQELQRKRERAGEVQFLGRTGERNRLRYKVYNDKTMSFAPRGVKASKNVVRTPKMGILM
ncbi:hypothetical protein AAC387_Pa07g1550 [Persea americana]